MMRDESTLANNFVGHLRHLELTRAKMERLAGDNYIVRRDIEQIYSGLYIDAVTSFERVIENLFLGLLVGTIYSKNKSVVARVRFSSHTVAREIICGGKNYVDWLPYDRFTEPRAKAFFRNGLPFTTLSKSEKDQIQEFLWIRNVIAHKSSNANKTFQSKVISGLPLTSIERTPTGFLRSVARVSPRQTRYEILTIDMSQIVRKVCT